MIFKINQTTIIDSDRDLSPEERHVLQKLLGWKSMVTSVAEFRTKKTKALKDGWNNSGPIRESESIRMIAATFEEEIERRLDTC